MNAPVAGSPASHAALAPLLRDVRAVVLDTDGVITDSARVHAAAWKTAFDAFLCEHPPTALVDGGEAARPGLPGKPRPDLFLEADRRGGFALVVGVDRTAGRDTTERLLRHGADIVVRDLGEPLVGGTPT